MSNPLKANRASSLKGFELTILHRRNARRVFATLPLLGFLLTTLASGQATASSVVPRPTVAAVDAVSPSTGRDLELVEITVTDVDLTSEPTVEFINGPTTLSAEVHDYDGDSSGGTIWAIVPNFDWLSLDTSELEFPMTYEEFASEVNTGGSTEFDVKVSQGGTEVTLVSGFTYQVPVMLGNANLRFGGCGQGEDDSGIIPQASVTPWGALSQPFYKKITTDPSDETNGNWYGLVYYPDYDYCDDSTYGDPTSQYALDTGLGTGHVGDGGPWHDSFFIETQSLVEDGETLDYFDMSLDASGVTITSASGGFGYGYGTLVASGQVMTGDGSDGTVYGSNDFDNLDVSYTYVLGEDSKFVKITTGIENNSGSSIQNINAWFGTQDDWVGDTDDPKKTRGNLIEGVFAPISDATEESKTILIQEDEGDAAGVLFHTTTSGAKSVIYDDCCSFDEVVDQDPSTADISTDYNDGSYAIYLPVGDLDDGQSTDVVWYYAAGNISDIGEIASEVEDAVIADGGGEPECDRCTGAGGGGGGGGSTPGTTPSTPGSTDSPSTAAGERPLIPGTVQPVAPVPTSGGVLPEVTPGASLATVNGEFVPVNIAQTATAEWTMTGDGFTFSMAVPNADSTPGAVVTLTRGREVTVSGDGFQPGSLVDVWLFSTPTYLGTVRVNADGTFSGSLTVPSTIAVGGHTLQANGNSSDGRLRSLNLGVQLVDRSFTLPKTGSSDTLGLVAVWLLAAGAFLVIARRRRLA